MQQPQPKHPGSLGHAETSRRRRSRCPQFIAALSLLLVAFHELLYRQTVNGDYPLFGLVSHAGSDLIVMGMTMTLAIVWLERAPKSALGRSSDPRSSGADLQRPGDVEPLGSAMTPSSARGRPQHPGFL